MKYQLPLVLYDPECPLCLRFKQGLEYLNKDMSFISIHENDVYSAFPALDRQACSEKVHLITTENKIVSGQEVVDYLLQITPGVSKLAWLLDNDQGKKVKEFFYQKVEELRELTTKKDSGCEQCPRK